MRAELLERYRALPLPTQRDEHWRFTDLAGFDPDAFSAAAGDTVAAAPTMLDIDAAGVAYADQARVVVENAPEGVRFEPLTDEHELLYSLVGWDEKFAAHNAAMWQHGLLVHVPAGVVLE
jgi:Fe-S cluster assembly scaffold protein SufB